MTSPKYILLIFSVALLWSCSKKNQFPTVPEIEFSSYSLSEKEDSLLPGTKHKIVHLKFSFKDAEGDIGLEQGDTAAPYDKNNFYNNLVITVFKKNNGVWEKGLAEGSRIPTNLTQYSGRKGLQGYIEIDKRESYPKAGDVIQYEIYIYDRALNKSNTVTTPEINF